MITLVRKTKTIPNADKELNLRGEQLGDDGANKIAKVLKVRVDVAARCLSGSLACTLVVTRFVWSRACTRQG